MTLAFPPMAPFPQDMDDATLAAFIAGTLPAERRQTVVVRLAQDEALREVLHMACTLLEAPRSARAEDHDDPPLLPTSASAETRMGWGLAGFIGLFLLGLGLRLGLGSPWPDTGGIHVAVTTHPLRVQWQVIPGAERYCVTIWRPETVQRVIRFETTTPQVDATHPFWRDLRAHSSGSWLLKVEALGPRDRVVETSVLVDLPVLQ